MARKLAKASASASASASEVEVVQHEPERYAVAQRVLDSWFASKKKATTKSYADGLADFAAFVRVPKTIDVVVGILATTPGQYRELSARYREHLEARGLAPGTVRRLMTTVQSLAKEAHAIGQIDWIPRAAKMPAAGGVRDVSGPPLKKIRAVFSHLEAADDKYAARDRLIVRLVWRWILRREEVSAIDMKDIDYEKHTIAVTRKRHPTPTPMEMDEQLIEYLHGWLEVRGDEPGPLFFGGRGHTLLRGTRLTGNGVRKILLRRSTEAGQGPIDMTPNSWRHAGIGELLTQATKHDVPDYKVVELSGHLRFASLQPYLDRHKDQQLEMSKWMNDALAIERTDEED